MNVKSDFELELHAYVDGNLDEAAMERVEDYLRDNPDAARRIWAYLQQKDDIRRFASGAVGDDLTPAEERLGKRLSRRLRPSKPHGVGQIFAVCALLLAGWLGHTLYDVITGDTHFAEEVIQAHMLSTTDPGDIPPLTAERITRLFSRIGEWERLPNLRGFGFEPIGAQLIPSYEGLVLHVPYRRSDGATMSYFLLHLNEDADIKPHRIRRDGINVVYWQHDQARHAVASPLPEDEVTRIVAKIDQPTLTP